MPRETFHNLPADKRARFVDAALDEFCARPFDQASVTTIVARLGIAKGSVYQYFEDKVDLFAWLVEEAGRRKLAVIGAVVPPPGFFPRLRAMYRAGLAFWQHEPRWAQVAMRLLEPSAEPRVDAVRRERLAMGRAWMRGQLAAAVASGELRADVDPEVTAPLVLAVVQDGLLNALLARAGVDLGDPHAAERLAAVPVEDLEAITDAAVGLLERGLGAR